MVSQIEIEPQGAGSASYTRDALPISGQQSGEWYYGYTLTASANSGYVFDHWIVEHETQDVYDDGRYSPPDRYTGESVTNPWSYLVGGPSKYDYLLTENHFRSFWGWRNDNIVSVKAVFKRSATKYSISTEANPVGSAVTTGDGKYSVGDRCTISAEPIQGYRFDKWTSNLGRSAADKVSIISVIGDETWTAKLIAITGLILYLPSNDKVLYSPSKNKVLRDE